MAQSPSPAKPVLAVFAKPPIAGQVKTRLAKDIGDVAAAQLARAMFDDLWRGIGQIGSVHAVVAMTRLEPASLGLDSRDEIWLQGEGDLGQRMERVLARGLQLSPTALVIGADIPLLDLSVIGRAIDALRHADAVIGPTDDGGFYLLGLRRHESGMLEDLPWSQPDTYAATVARLRSLHYTVATIDPWFDVDTLADMQRLAVLLADAPPDCYPATRQVLQDQ